MEKYIGTKCINAKPMTRQEYNDFRGWTLPADENGADEGFLVEYVDGGKANTAEYAGYVSWSPKDVFEKAYHSFSKLDFGGAVVALRNGHKVAREGWNGKGMFLSYVGARSYDVGISAMHVDPYHLEDRPAYLPWIGIKTADNKFVPWLASQTDVLADDWTVVD